MPAGFGAAYGTAKSGVGIAAMGVMRPELVMKSIVPVVMAGVLGIYGLIIAVIISTGSEWHAALNALQQAGGLLLPAALGSVSALTHGPSGGCCGLVNLTMSVLPACPPAVNQTADKAYYFFDGYAHFASGLACGLAALGAGMAIGIVGDAGVRANAQQPKLFVGVILILIFAEALGLYGLIGAAGWVQPWELLLLLLLLLLPGVGHWGVLPG